MANAVIPDWLKEPWMRLILLLVLICSICVILLVVMLFWFLSDVHYQVDRISWDTQQLLVTANQATVNLRDAAAAARDASTTAKDAANAEAGYWQKTSVETYKTIASLRLTITRTDQTLNDALGPQLVSALHAAADATTGTASDLHETVTALQPTLKNLADASAGAARAMNDPSITASLANVQETSAATAATAAQLQQIAEHLDGAAADVQAFVHRETTPARGTWNVIKTFLMEFAGPGAQVATAVK